MAEGFEFYEVLPKFINKAKDFLTEAKKNGNPFFVFATCCTPQLWFKNQIIMEFQMLDSMVSLYLVDDQVGNLLEHLKNLGLEEDTIIVFTSDNGPYWKQPYIDEFNHRAAGELRGMKGDIYEGGHRIPHIVKWPRKIKPGTTNNSLNTLASFYSTVADLLKLEVSSSDSYSIFSELINDVKIVGDRSIIHHSSEDIFLLEMGIGK